MVGTYAGIDDKKLYDILSELNYVPEEELKRAQAIASAESISLYDALLKSDIISDENLGKLIAYSLQLPFTSLAQASIPEDILHITPQAVAAQFHVLTYGMDEEKGLKIAASNHLQTDVFDMLAKKAGVKNYRVFFATDRDIQDALRLYKKELGLAFESLLASKTGDVQVEVPVAKIVDTVIDYAYINKASDVHIEPTRGVTLVRFRIDGILHDMVRLPHATHGQLVARIKVLARLRTDEHFSAQDGRMRMSVEQEDLDVRVSIVPTVTGEKVVLRLLSSHNRQFSLTDLGMGEADLKKIRAGFMRPFGMVMSTGPTGSGKTTSMYAILKILNTREKNIATIEDPVEYEIDGINQIQANPKTNLTFANGLRSLLRQDPDIMYVGEIRDEETADIAINSAMTGHLVLSTLHTNNAATTLPRLMDMKIEPFLVASTVNVIIGQRLVRKICDRCRVSFELKKTEHGWHGEEEATATQLSHIDPKQLSRHFGDGSSVRLYKGKGCNVCHETGYRGRVGIFEVLEVSPKIEALITQKADADAILQQAISEGMTTMMDDGLDKVQQGITTVGEIMRATRA
ncbi:MAG TPA: ATPase, T2SS/T4P/T4SS family [Candidatus Saccharimonadales bacterium]|nr:ATPase, T2SS/T4P/T4SS family [Candidatus Saccharimonadales bacterium]